MSVRRPSLATAGALACGALAMWVSLGALTFVEADSRGAYVGILPPLSWLMLLLAAAAACAFVVCPSPRVVAPLWLSAVALLPWLPVRLPLSVFIWTGHTLIWLWAAIAVAMLSPFLGRLYRFVGSIGIPHSWAPVGVGLVTAAVYGLGAWAVRPAHLNGDEPHYLIITQSLLRDHDLKIENNHRQGDYEAYVKTSRLSPDFLRRGTDGEIYSIHAPGLPVLVAVPFAYFGYAGAVAGLVLLGALGAGLVWLLAWRVTGDAAASWFAWAAVALSVPFFFHTSSVFPDAPGAVFLLVALFPLVDARARAPRYLLAVGASLAALPWLHSRFAVLSAAAAIVIAARLVSDPSERVKRFIAFAACPAASAAAWFWFFQAIYGTPDPSVVYGGTTSTAAGNIVRGAPGLLFDQQFGLIANAPVFLCAVAGLFVMLRQGRRRLGLELLVLIVPYFFVVGFFFMWWAGTTPPARFLVPVSLIAAVPIAVWYATASPVARTAGLTALVFSLFMTATLALVDPGTFVFNFRDGMSRVAVWLTPVVDLTRALPSLFQNPPPIVILQTAIWLVAIGLALAVAARVARRGTVRVVVVLGLVLQATSMAAVSSVWQSNDAAVPRPYAASPAVLRRHDPGANQVAVAYRPFRRLQTPDLLSRIVLARAFLTRPGAESASVTHVPAGTYEARGTAVGFATGRLAIKTNPVSGPLAAWDVSSLGSTWSRQVVIPIAVAALHLDADGPALTSLRDVSLHPVAISTPEDGFENREAQQGARYGSATLFLLAGDAWVEPGGTWVAGDSNAEFVIAPDPDTVLQLFIRNGPMRNVVTLQSGAWQREFRLQPREERLIPMETDRRRRLTPLRVSATRGYRPADVDQKSQDLRYLGVWIETK